MNDVRYKLLVMSGKGGVGKTTVSVNLAYSLAKKGFKTGLLDIDVHGPNVPKMLKLESEKLGGKGEKGIVPVQYNNLLKVVSMAFLLKKEDAVIWRGPMKHKLINQFVNDVEWGELDYLVVDFPPGTGDEAISISQLLKDITGSIIVSTPQQVSMIDAERAIGFSRKVDVPVVGIIENMAGELFGKGTMESFAKTKGVNYLGHLNLNREVVLSSDSGIPFVDNEDLDVTKSFKGITDKVIEFCKHNQSESED
jgi:ATP-binding protein involved in chromosome partitioning